MVARLAQTLQRDILHLGKTAKSRLLSVLSSIAPTLCSDVGSDTWCGSLRLLRSSCSRARLREPWLWRTRLRLAYLLRARRRMAFHIRFSRRRRGIRLDSTCGCGDVLHRCWVRRTSHLSDISKFSRFTTNLVTENPISVTIFFS